MSTPPEYLSKGELAYREVRAMILSGRLAPGSRVDQYEIAASLGMSLTPVREAVQRLAADGLLSANAHKFVHVADVSAKEASDLVETRMALEPAALELAAARFDEADRSAITAALAELEPFTDFNSDRAITIHRAFHRTVYAACHNEVMIRALDDLWDKADRYRRTYLTLPRGEDERRVDYEQHHQIAGAVLAGEADGAARVAREHIRLSVTPWASEALERHRETSLAERQAQAG
ncbi:MAG: GntR family transcriptional regulator [Bifidobacteriaceae bacterium]|jgi:DNA-binding GntR family transcriptional regulator|nr:GntR family transcriptional regulator [Bifidobacteriaceae bacterium]